MWISRSALLLVARRRAGELRVRASPSLTTCYYEYARYEVQANFKAYGQDIIFSSLQRGEGIKNVGVESERTRDWPLQQTSLGKAATIGFYLIGSFAKHRANQRMWKQHQELLSRTASPSTTPTPPYTTVSHFLSRASGVVHLGLLLPFLPIPDSCALSHPGELGAGLSQTWPSDRCHCTSLSRRWYVPHQTLACHSA